MTPVANLFVRFKGWATVRLPTDPDPADEPRGASGYTFAFAGEPDLDRIIRFQPGAEPEYVRPGAPWQWGVGVFDAFRLAPDGGRVDVPALVDEPVSLIGGAKLENRNWLFTLPGWEPVVPFDLQIGDGAVELRRTAPLTEEGIPVFQVPTATLMAQGASGANMEPETIGTATGIWDAYALMQQRVAVLQDLIAKTDDQMERQCLESRLYEVEYAVANPRDRRVMAHYAVERFSFPVDGPGATVPTVGGPLVGLDASARWTVSYYMGAWDFDTFGVWVQGCLQVPYQAGA